MSPKRGNESEQIVTRIKRARINFHRLDKFPAGSDEHVEIIKIDSPALRVLRSIPLTIDGCNSRHLTNRAWN